MKYFKKILWAIKRHPFLYTTRFRLLSRNSSVEGIKDCAYNNSNKKEDIPSNYYEVNAKILNTYNGNSDLEFVKHLSVWLRSRIKGGPGLSEPSDQALRVMLEGKGGVCSDMVQIFNNFCVINDIQVREWGVTHSPFNREYGGHSFNEVYCKELEKWVFIDSWWCILFYDTNFSLLSVVELFELIRNEIKITYEPFAIIKDFNEPIFRNNFFNKHSTPFVVCNYSNKKYDYYLNALLPNTPVFIIHFLMFILQKSYYFNFPLDNYKKIFS